MLERVYETMEPTTSKSKIEKLMKNLIWLYEDHYTRSCASSSSVSSTPTLHELVTESPFEDDLHNVSIFHIIFEFHI